MGDIRHTHTRLAIFTKIAVAASAGDFTVPGIDVGDDLLQVEHVEFTLAEGAPNVISWVASATVTSEFSIIAANTINNDGGTSFTGGLLFVTYIDKSLK